MFDLKKYKNINIQTSIRFPQTIYNKLKLLSFQNEMSFNSVVISCIQYALNDLPEKEDKNDKRN